jgi:hypothetical protein|uniref:Uncharacterized protein n=1 Tax=viral metagenome TaxID=1070528 RepID=A0A6C0DAT7_9ZZZZ
MNFDLNIENYNTKDLEEIFNLQNGNYDTVVIETKCSQLKNNILVDNDIEDTVRAKTLIFLDEAKKILSSELNSSHVIKKLANAYNMNSHLIESDVINAGNTSIIEKPKTSFANSFPNEFFPGVINPLKKRTTRQNLNVDTRFRSNYFGSTSSNFQFELPMKFSKVLQMQLSAFEMPVSFYNISKKLGNNFFSIFMVDSTGANYVNHLVTVPDGNYTPQSITAFLNNLMGADGLDIPIQFIYNLDATGSGSGQMIIGVKSGYDNIFILNFQDNMNGDQDFINALPLKLGWLLGFRNGIYSGNNNYVSEGLVDLSLSRYLYLVVDDYNNNVNNNFYSAFNSSILNKNILARISIQPTGNNMVSQNNLSLITSPRQYFGPVDIQKFNIQLLDEYGRIVQMNFMDYSFCLTFTSVYDI